MKKSRYFADLIRSYNEEIDDLLSDSEGKSVLQKRLNDKRSAFAAILPMIEYSPEMVSVVFYGAFSFKSVEIMQQIVLSEPGNVRFLPWIALKRELSIAAWAEPLIALTLKEGSGDDFLVSTAGLEFLRQKDNFSASLPKPKPDEDQEEERDEGGERGERGDEDDDNGEQDLREAGADWLTEQGFEPLER